MINDLIYNFLDLDEHVKDEAWASEKVKFIMRDAKPVISKEKYEQGKSILFGEFSEESLKKVFTGETMERLRKKLAQTTVFFLEKVRNAIIDERNNAGLNITVNSLDPEKDNKKKQDKELLKNRKGIEALVNDFTANNGMPPRKFGGDDFHGNVDQFDEMGYNEFDPTDLANFFDNGWALLPEIYLQNAINAVSKLNDVNGDFDKYINDILICLHTWSQVYVDDLEGRIYTEHLYPWEVYILGATGSNNFKDHQGVYLPKTTNLRGFMKRFANNFNMDRDWEMLLRAANGGDTVHTYTGITDNNMLVWGTAGKTMDFNAMLDKQIRYGYCEFKTVSQVSKQKGVTKEGNIVDMQVSRLNAPIDGSETHVKYKEDTYRAYFLEVGTNQPKLIKWGKLYMQPFEGVNDEYSGYSIIGTKREGIPVVDIVKPYYNMIQITFKMLEMLVNDIKPDGAVFNYSSIIKVAEYLKAAKDIPSDKRTGIDMFLQMVEESPNILADTPTGQEGEILGGGNLGLQVNKKGLNATANDVMKVIDWAEQKAIADLGAQGIEFAEAKDGFKLSIENRRRSRASTAFIDFILLNHLKSMNVTVLNYVKDISKFKDIPAYKYLHSLIGDKAMNFIASMEKAPHRYAIFLDTFNNDIELAEIKAMAQDARLRNEISLEQYLILRSIENPKQAAAYLAYERKKQQKQMELAAMDAQKRAAAEAEQAFKYQKALDDNKGEWARKARAEEALGFTNAAQINAQASITTAQLKEEGQNKRVAAEAINDIDKIAVTAAENARQSAL